MDRITLHLMLAVYLSPNPENQVRVMVKRYLQKETSPKTRRILKCILRDPDPVQTIIEVYHEWCE